MRIFRTLQAFRAFRREIALPTSIGLVPTMGALHQGHISLVERAVAENDLALVSIFVNPTQFGPQEDFSQYPRTLEQDCALLEKLGVAAVFAPDQQEIYPATSQITFQIGSLAGKLCARSRPGHMEGVLQIVSILFHLTQPRKAYFGEKDFQQYLIIRQMVRELHFPLEVVPCPIVREPDGLAMSSRNVYLSPDEREQALFLHDTLQALRERQELWVDREAMRAFVAERLRQYPLVRLDYFEVLDGETLAAPDQQTDPSRLRAFMAAFLGSTRLIDNMSLT